MLDSDLAKLYQCKNGTKEVNQAVKNNIDKFPEIYSWILTNDESKNLLVKIIDQKSKVDTRGASFKDLGSSCFGINKIENENVLKSLLLELNI